MTAPSNTPLATQIWRDAKPYLAAECNISPGAAGAIIGGWMGLYDHGDIREALKVAMLKSDSPEGLQDPRSYIRAILDNNKRNAAPELGDLDNRTLLRKIGFMDKYYETRPHNQNRGMVDQMRDEARRRGLVR